MTQNKTTAGARTRLEIVTRGCHFRGVFQAWDKDGNEITSAEENRLHRLFETADDLLAERQAISKALGEYTWTTPEHAEQILRDFIEKFYDSDAVDKATGTARLDRAVEKMAATEGK